MTYEEYLKYQVRNVPLKLLVSALIPGYFAVNSKTTSSNLIVTSVVIGIVLYGLMSCLSAFAKATGNWFFGLILFGIIAAILASQKLPYVINSILIFVLLFWGIIRDAYRCIRLFKVLHDKKKENNAEDSKIYEDYYRKYTQEKINKEQQQSQSNYSGNGSRHEKAPGENTSSSTLEYFRDCDSKESITKRYRDLCKVYHPDMGNGSPEIFNKIQNEYNIIRKKYE